MLAKMVSDNIFGCSPDEENKVTDSKVLLDNKSIKLELSKIRNKKKVKYNQKV